MTKLTIIGAGSAVFTKNIVEAKHINFVQNKCTKKEHERLFKKCPN